MIFTGTVIITDWGVLNIRFYTLSKLSLNFILILASLPTSGMEEVYKTTYSNIDVYESIINGYPLMRRCDDNWVNATQILKIAGFLKTQRTRILEREVHQLVHKKVQGGHGKFQGTWVPLDFAQELALKHNIQRENLNVLFFDPENSPEIAVKVKSTTRSNKSSTNKQSNATNTSNTSNTTQKQKQNLTSSTSIASNMDNQSLNKKRPQIIESSSSFATTDNYNINDNNNIKNELPKKLNSPQKLKKIQESTPLRVEPIALPLTLPPTFGQYNESPIRLHSKSRSASHIPQSFGEFTPTPHSAPPVSNNRLNSDAAFFGHNVQPYQLKAQRELEYFQQQQHKLHQQQQQQQHPPHHPPHHPAQQHRQYNQHPHHQYQNSSHQLKYAEPFDRQQHQNFYRSQSVQTIHENDSYVQNQLNDSVVSTDNSHMQFGNESIISPDRSYIPIDVNNSFVRPRSSTQYQQQYSNYLNENNEERVHPAISKAQLNMLQSPGSIYRHTRHHSSPHINTEQNGSIDSALSAYNGNSFNNNHQFDEFIDKQSYFTKKLISFFVDDTEIPPFLYNPPKDFDVNQAIDDEGHTPLHWACALASLKVIKILTKLNADTLLLNIQGMNALSKLIHFNNSYDSKNFHEILPLLKHCLIVPDAHQNTPVHYLAELSSNEDKIAATLYYLENILTFIKNQQNEAERNSRTTNDKKKLLDLLINHCNLNGESALDIALRSNCKEFILLLLENGADVSKVGGWHNIHPDILKELNKKSEQFENYNTIINQNNVMVENQPIFEDNINPNNFIGNENYRRNNDYPLLDHVNINSYNENISKESQTNKDNSLIVDVKNPFLESSYDSNIKYKIKDTPHTIDAQRTPESEDQDGDKENVMFDAIMTNSFTSNKNNRNDTLLSPTPSKVIKEKVIKAETNLPISDVADKAKSIEEDLKVKKSNISFNELDNFVNGLPNVICKLKSSLENKTDQLTYSIDSINNLNSNIQSLTTKNGKLLKKIAKCSHQDISNIDFNKLASLDSENITSFVNQNLSKIDSKLQNQTKHLFDLYGRSQALKIAKLVRNEEDNIDEDLMKPKGKKLELAIQLTLLQIIRRKIIQKRVTMHIDEESNNNDFSFDEAFLDSTISKSDANNLKMMKSKLSVYKKLISTICGLPYSEISNELLNEIEKVIS